MNFFDKTDKKFDTKSKKVEKVVILTPEQIGKLALVDSISEQTSDDHVETCAETSLFANEMFGDIATIIETYNSFVPLYFTRSRKLTKVDCTKIEYKTFVQMLKYDTREAKMYYVKLIKNMLVIFLEHENAFEVKQTKKKYIFTHESIKIKLEFTFNKKAIELFDKPISMFTQNTCFLQEICRVLVNVIYFNLNAKNDEKLFDPKDFDQVVKDM